MAVLDMAESFKDILLSQPEREALEVYRRSHQIYMLTIVLSDLVGYSSLCEKLTEPQALEIVHVFKQAARTRLELENRGVIIKWMGDGVLAVFADPVSAVFGVAAFHEDMSKTNIADSNLQLRSGIHIGQVAVEVEGVNIDVFGRHVNRTARVQAAAMPGEILATDVVEDNVWTWVSGGVSKISFGQRRPLELRGIDRTVIVYSVYFSRDGFLEAA